MEMTVLHIASPFAVSAPINESQSSASTNDGPKDGQGNAGQTLPAADSQRTGPTRDSGIVDARDTHVPLAGAADLPRRPAATAAAAGSLEAVLAAYGQDGAFGGTSGEPPDPEGVMGPSR